MRIRFKFMYSTIVAVLYILALSHTKTESCHSSLNKFSLNFSQVLEKVKKISGIVRRVRGPDPINMLLRKRYDEAEWCVVCIMFSKPSSVHLCPAVWLVISQRYLEFVTIHKAKLPSGSVLICMLHSLKIFFGCHYWTLLHAFHQLSCIPFSVLSWEFWEHWTSKSSPRKGFYSINSEPSWQLWYCLCFV